MNGWRRLFVLLSVFWAVVVVLISLTAFPKNNHYITRTEFREAIAWYNGTDYYRINLAKVTETKDSDAAVVSLLASNKVWVKADQSDKRDAELTKRFDQVRANHQARVNKLPRQRVNYMLFVLAVIAIPCAVMYAFGSSIGWVARGFRGSK